MSKYDKLIQKIIDNKDISYEEAEKVLISYVYVPKAPRSGSSHITFRRSESEKIVLVKTQKPLKKYLIKAIKEAITKND